MQLAVQNNIKTIAFPAISTGVYGFPKRQAAQIALREVVSFLKSNKQLEQVILVSFDDENYQIYQRQLDEI